MIAVCDVLGFSNLVYNNPLEMVVARHVGWLRKSLHHSLHKNEFPTEIPAMAALQTHDQVGIAWFSDTVLMYSMRDEQDAFRELIATVGWLIFETNMAVRTRIRGGISYGEAFIDRENSIFVGKAIVDAYKLEKQQEWSGAALTESATNKIPEWVRSGKSPEWWVVPYEVPVKKDSTTFPTLAVDWTRGFHDQWWPIRWSKSSELPTDADRLEHPDICRKFENTKAFRDSVCMHCR